jgi:hypothetical protein
LSEEEHGGFEVAIQMAELDPSHTQEPHTYMAQPRQTQRWLGLAQAARGCRVQRFGAAEKREEKRGGDASVKGGAGDGWNDRRRRHRRRRWRRRKRSEKYASE